MSIFSEISESKIFKNEQALSTEYLPKLLPHREGQIKLIARNLLPASKGRRPQNMFIFGVPGIGKTASVKFIFRDFEEYSERVKTVYINCWDYNTSHAILAKLVVELGFFVQRRGFSKDEIKERLIEAIRKTRKSIIICLDEVDQLIYKDSHVLYDLLRFDQYVNTPIGLIMISNNPFIFKNVDPRIRSSLDIQEIEFKPYTIVEMKNILQNRAKLAFHPGVVGEGIILLAANHAVSNGGDVRIGLECLKKAGRKAEEKCSDKVKIEHMKEVIANVRAVKPKIIEEKLNFIEKTILEILDEKGELISGKLYDEYRKRVKEPISLRGFREYVNHLEQIGMVETRFLKGVRGRTRIIKRKE